MIEPYYNEDGITIYNADCRDVLPQLAPVDLVLTDPPYGVGYKGRWNSDWAEIANDKEIGWIKPTFEMIYSVMADDSFAVSFYGWPQADAFVSAWKYCNFRLLSHFVFIKNQIGLGYFSRGQHEQAYLLAKGSPAKPEQAISDVIHWQRVFSPVHPTEKPVGAITPLLRQFCKGVVLDPFMGSGTTLRAAKDLGLKAIGIEIERKYCDIAVERLRQQAFSFEAAS
jgi:DNA modification methylase